MTRICMASVLLFMATFVMAEDSLVVWARWKPDMEKAIRAYLDVCSTKQERAKWNARIDERCEERSLQTVALDWFFDNENDLTDKEPEAIKEACFFFLRFIETKTPPPLQMRGRMTDDNFSMLVEFLEEKTEELKNGDFAGRRRGDG